MTENDAIKTEIYDHPEGIGIGIGFKDLQAIHGEWIREMVFGDGDYTLMAHRGAYKSSCLAVAIALTMVMFPDQNIIFLRKADNDVTEMIGMVKKILQHDLMRWICKACHGEEADLILTEDTKDHISTNLWKSPMGAPQLLGIGLKSSITGKHAMIVITDDICNINDRVSRAEREKTKLQFQELQNIRNPGGRIINLGTKWHADDVFTLMDNIHEYDYKKTGLLSDEKIQKLREVMTASLFAANYELRFVAEDDVIFTDPVTGADPALVEQGEMHIDAAYGGEDYTAMTIMRNAGGKHYVLGKLWQKAVDAVEPQIIDLYSRFMCGKVYCEDNADKGYLAKDLKNNGLRAVSYHESENKYMKIVTHLKGEWKNVVFVDGTDPEYIDQICDYNENADHDDAPDSLASMIRKKKNKETEAGGYKSIFGGVY